MLFVYPSLYFTFVYVLCVYGYVYCELGSNLTSQIPSKCSFLACKLNLTFLCLSFPWCSLFFYFPRLSPPCNNFTTAIKCLVICTDCVWFNSFTAKATAGIFLKNIQMSFFCSTSRTNQKVIILSKQVFQMLLLSTSGISKGPLTHNVFFYSPMLFVRWTCLTADL